MIKNTKKDSEMKLVKYIEIFLKKKKSKSQKMHEKDIKILLKRKKKGVSIIRDVSRSYLSTEEILFNT